MADPVRVRVWALALIDLHLDRSWSFGFDRARTRAGLTNYRDRRITVSRILAERASDDEVHQTLLHEVAHALAGPRAGHGPRWRRIAGELGYVGNRTYDGPTAVELARWEGVCPNGHVLHRHRRPTKPSSCAKCSRRFDERYLIRWQERAA